MLLEAMRSAPCRPGRRRYRLRRREPARALAPPNVRFVGPARTRRPRPLVRGRRCVRPARALRPVGDGPERGRNRRASTRLDRRPGGSSRSDRGRGKRLPRPHRRRSSARRCSRLGRRSRLPTALRESAGPARLEDRDSIHARRAWADKRRCQRRRAPAGRITSARMVTLFTAPKPFAGHIAVIQRNAMRSWAQLPGCELVAFGDEEGIDAMASEIGATHLPDVARCGRRERPSSAICSPRREPLRAAPPSSVSSTRM